MGFWNRIPNTGLIPTIDPRSARYDVLFGGIEATAPSSFSLLNKMPQAEYQGVMPFCISYATTKYREFQLKKLNMYRDLDPDDLAARSGTSKKGNSVNSVLDVGKKFGFTNSSDHPTTPKTNITWADWDKLAKPALLTAEAQSRALEVALQGYAYIPSYDLLTIQNYLVVKQEPLLITIGLGTGFNNRGDDVITEQPLSYSAYHALLLIGYDKQGNWQVFDSLGEPVWWLVKTYDLMSVTSITPLPLDWKEKQDNVQKSEFDICLNHYSKSRNLQAEVMCANDLMNAFTKFRNQSVFEATGRFWTVFINAVAYGNYSVTDCVNNCYNWRRSGKHIFNFNTIRK